MLVKLRISLPSNSRQDRKLTEAVKLDKSLGANSGKWLKTLYPAEAFKPLVEIGGEIRTWNYEHSLNWADDGWRILPTITYLDCQAKMREFKAKFELAQWAFLKGYDSYVKWARSEHNGTFDAAEYPGAHKVEQKFALETEFRPLPSGDDFRVNLQAEEVEAIRASINDGSAAAVQDAMRELWQRLADPIRHMVPKLQEDKGKFRDSLVTNITDITRLIPKLNIAGDARLDQLAKDAEALPNVAPDTLREGQAAGTETAAMAQEILNRMAGYFQLEQIVEETRHWPPEKVGELVGRLTGSLHAGEPGFGVRASACQTIAQSSGGKIISGAGTADTWPPEGGTPNLKAQGRAWRKALRRWRV